MGGSHASNVIDNYVGLMISTTNSVTQQCTPTASIDQMINVISSCPNSNISISHINMTAAAEMDVKCVQNAVQSADTKASIDQTAEQMANAVTQSLSLNPASAEAKNIMKLSMNVGIAVRNAVSQSIGSAVALSQVIQVPDGCNIDVSYVNMDAFSSTIAEAVQKTSQVATATAQLKQAAKQSATAKQESMMLMLVIIIIAVVMVGVVGGKEVLGYLRPVLTVAVPVVAVGGMYYWYDRRT